MCHLDNLVELISPDNNCMFYFIFNVIQAMFYSYEISPESNEYNFK